MENKELIGHSLFLYSFNTDMAPRDKVKFIREFLGYRLSKNGKRYSYGGIRQKLGGTKISNNTFIAPAEKLSVIKAYLESRGVNFVVKE